MQGRALTLLGGTDRPQTLGVSPGTSATTAGSGTRRVCDSSDSPTGRPQGVSHRTVRPPSLRPARGQGQPSAARLRGPGREGPACLLDGLCSFSQAAVVRAVKEGRYAPRGAQPGPLPRGEDAGPLLALCPPPSYMRSSTCSADRPVLGPRGALGPVSAACSLHSGFHIDCLSPPWSGPHSGSTVLGVRGQRDTGEAQASGRDQQGAGRRGPALTWEGRDSLGSQGREAPKPRGPWALVQSSESAAHGTCDPGKAPHCLI